MVDEEDCSDDEFQGYIGELEYQQEGEETAEHESECDGDRLLFPLFAPTPITFAS